MLTPDQKHFLCQQISATCQVTTLPKTPELEQAFDTLGTVFDGTFLVQLPRSSLVQLLNITFNGYDIPLVFRHLITAPPVREALAAMAVTPVDDQRKQQNLRSHLQ